MFRKMLILFAMVSSLALMALPARADTVIDFQGGVGTFNYGGSGGPLTGTATGSLVVLGLNTPANAGVPFSITNGALNFTTGNLLSFNSGTGVYTFGPGGSITITGTCCDGAGASQPLLSGTFVGASIGPNGVFKLWLGYGPDIKDPALVEFFGMNPDTTKWNFTGNGTYIGTLPSDGGDFTVTAYSFDISNNAVPEPASLVLIGSGLLGLYGISRRRAKK